MAKFSLDFDDIDFSTDDHLAWNFTLENGNSFGGNSFDQFHSNGIDQDVMLGCTGDALQGWLHQQVTLNEDAPRSNMESFQSSILSGASSQPMDSSVNAVPRHDSTTSMQSMISAASSSSRRGQRIVGAYPCGKCDRVFDVPSDLRHHERNHMATENRPYACHHCGQRFLYPKDRTRHLLRKHIMTGAPSGSLSRTQSLDDVPMLSVDDAVPVVSTGGAHAISSFGHPADFPYAPAGKCTCGNRTSDEQATGSFGEESVRFSESAIERLQNRLDHVHKDLMSTRTRRVEVAEMHARAPDAIPVSHDRGPDVSVDISSESMVDLTPHDTSSRLQYLLAQQQLQINRLKLEVQFATQDAAFWLDECNHYAWFLRKIPNAPRPPIYAVPEQNGRVSLVQYAKSWLGAIRMMFSSTDIEATKTEVGSHLVDRLAHELDHLFMQN